jgi:hypothetical protein
MGFYAVLIVAVVLAAVAISQAPGPVEPPPVSLEDFEAPTAAPGRPVPVVFGTVYLKAPNVVWYGDLGYEAVKTKGGK